MTYRQIEKMKYDALCYNQFIMTCALYKRVPFKVVVFESEKDSATVLIFSRTQSETVTTRHMKFSKKNADDIIDRLQDDFTGLQVEYLTETTDL
ncbi:MAG: hypothetical protein IJR00_01345 [Lachnospiraceae bacterium]|nr:hypothetical protein [Lachnospiraceae bacterium]